MLKNIITISFVLISILTFSQSYPNNTFTISKTNACVGEEITFTSTSTPGSSGLPIIKESWDFGDGTLTEVNGANNSITHSYSSSGVKQVFFFATNSNGTNDVAYVVEVTVSSNPIVNFSVVSNSCSLPTTIDITNSSSSGNYSYDWDFDNGQTSSDYVPSGISYSSSDTYSISLTVTNNLTGCFSNNSNDVIINEFIADFTLSSNEICENEFLTISDNSIGSTNWSWNNGNNNTSTNQNPTFSYSSAGSYDITLTATNSSNGCTDQETKSITVHPRPVLDILSNPSIGCSPLDVTFTNNSTNGDAYVWDFGDGSPTFSGETPPIHTYNNDGSYTVSLDVTNNFGCARQGTASLIEVTPAISDFESNIVNGCSPINVQFNDLSIAANQSDDPIVSWNWDLGNGNTSNSPSPPIETYTSGKYDISLTITTQNGCVATKSVSEYIQVGAIDSVGFSNTPDTICAKGGTASFTDLTLITVPHDPSEIVYDWNFGDSEPGRSSVKNPTYNYPQDTGSFDVSLTVTFRGCIDSFRIDSAVFAWSPISKFTANSDDKCSPSSFPVQFDITDSSKIGRLGDNVEMVYKWGDPLNSTTNFSSSDYDTITDKWSSNFNYTNYGTYTIWQIVSNNTTGCIDSTSQQVTISKVAADFTFNPDTVCLGSSLSLNDLSTSIVGNIIDVSYAMATESSISGNVNSVTNYTFINSGIKDITLTATDENGCSGDTTLQATVFSLPVASIIPDDQTPCAPQVITYSNNSSFSGNTHATTIVSSVWDLPDGSTINNATEAVPFSIATQGTFVTTLYVTDDFGCISDTATSIITVSKPIANFNNPGTLCNSVSFNVLNTTTNGGVSYQWTLDNSEISTDEDLTYTINETNNSSTAFDYKLTLIASDINGCQDSTDLQINLSAPIADFTYSLTGENQSSSNEFTCPPVFVETVNNSTSPNISNWTYGNGNSGNNNSPSFAYYVPGTYTLELDIINQFGCTDDTMLVDYVTIGGPKATPVVTPPLDFCKNLFIFSVEDTSQVDSYLWDFGDNTSSILDSIEHGYPLEGTYYPVLTVYDKANCSVQYNTDTISVLNELTAIHTASPNPGETKESITFSDQSLFKDSIISWFWEFGDFNNYSVENSTNSSQQFSYKYPFTYKSVLTVTDKFGCTSSDTVLVKVNGDFETANVFTPNNDGINDIFEFDEDIFESYDVLVLNRWGNIVYDKKGVTGTYIWNGTHDDGNECTDGVYFFKVVGTIKDLTPFEVSGYVTKVKG